MAWQWSTGRRKTTGQSISRVFEIERGAVRMSSPPPFSLSLPG